MPHVAILICTYRGEAHLPRQLDTIAEQTHHDWCIHASDDASTDGTRPILEAYAHQLGEARMRVYTGPCKGFAANFLSLVSRPEVQADYYAFTDQDDEWDPAKLERAITALSALPADTPAIYGSRSELIDGDGRHIGFSKVFMRPPSFANALVQNMVTGNTMVLNDRAMQVVRAGGDVSVSAHDWWAYLIVTGSGGRMVYDPYPTIRYRQHGTNLYGANTTLRAKWVRVRRVFKGDFRLWNEQNIEALQRCKGLLTDQNRRCVEQFERARHGSRLVRFAHLLRSGVYRQTWDGQLGLFVAVLSKRL